MRKIPGVWAAAALLLLAACAPGRPPAPPPLPADIQIPPFAKVPYEPFSRVAAVQIAFGEWRAFGSPVVWPNTELAADEERQNGLWQRVGLYWWLGLPYGTPEQAWTGKHDAQGMVFSPQVDGDFAWSAAFISYVMRMAGAAKKFPYAIDHAHYINLAREHDLGQAPDVALDAERLDSYAPQLGDLICEWRAKHPVSFDDLPAPRFPGHCDLVVGINPGQLEVIGGNVDNAVSMEYIPTTPDGHLARPDGTVVDPDPDHHWFVVLRVLYDR